MKSSELNQPIVIVGMMGVGKSYIGSRLADAFGVDFIDTDKIIEHTESITITQIFANNGEQYFRDLEYHTIKNTLKSRGMVVAVGGGAYTFRRNREIIDDIGISVWLDASPKTICRRISDEGNRPLLFGDNTLSKILQLREIREADYSKARLQFWNDELDNVPDYFKQIISSDLSEIKIKIMEVLMSSKPYDITDKEWQLIEKVLPTGKRGPKRKNDRRVINGIFFILHSGKAWSNLPCCYGPHKTCYNRYYLWSKDGTWARIMRDLMAITHNLDDDITSQSNASILDHRVSVPTTIEEKIC